MSPNSPYETTDNIFVPPFLFANYLPGFVFGAVVISTVGLDLNSRIDEFRLILFFLLSLHFGHNLLHGFLERHRGLQLS